MSKVGVIHEGTLENALEAYSKAWLKKTYPQYPIKHTTTEFRSGFTSTTYDYGDDKRKQEIDRKAIEIVKAVAEREAVDLVIRASAVAHINDQAVVITDECVAEANKLPV